MPMAKMARMIRVSMGPSVTWGTGLGHLPPTRLPVVLKVERVAVSRAAQATQSLTPLGALGLVAEMRARSEGA